jgi:hypothetical protein
MFSMEFEHPGPQRFGPDEGDQNCDPDYQYTGDNQKNVRLLTHLIASPKNELP